MSTLMLTCEESHLCITRNTIQCCLNDSQENLFHRHSLPASGSSTTTDQRPKLAYWICLDFTRRRCPYLWATMTRSIPKPVNAACVPKLF